jgi:Zn finger protein HypA/HybF involved in hydrogenase expression
MSHSALICHEPFAEVQLGAVSDTERERPKAGVVCPSCGSDSFRIWPGRRGTNTNVESRDS